jgi:autotransporter-associated beta strand protein
MIFKNNSTAGSAGIENRGSINFLNRSTAGSADIVNDSGCITQFLNRSTAGSADILNEVLSFTQFSNSSTAGSANITNLFFSVMSFGDRSSAGSANITNFDSTLLSFSDKSTAGNATIGSAGKIAFSGSSTAGSANISVGGISYPGFPAEIDFADSSTAGSANIVVVGGFLGSHGVIDFADSSEGGTAQIDLEVGLIGPLAFLDISGHNAPGVTIGSIEGGGFVVLGSNNLTVGSNNLSTTFSGVIQDSGSLTKIGSGTLVLSGANTYTGDTNVNRGVLQVDGSITSNTFVNHGGTLAGTGTIDGNVTNSGRVSPGSAGAPGMLTVVSNYTQAQYAALMIQIAGMSPDQFSVLNVLGNANLNGFLDPVLLNGFVPTIGDSFTFLDYASLTGGFSHIKDRVFDNGMLQWSVIYEANHAILTVEQHVPDQGSTFLLLTLGLLGLVMFRRRLERRQA